MTIEKEDAVFRKALQNAVKPDTEETPAFSVIIERAKHIEIRWNQMLVVARAGTLISVLLISAALLIGANLWNQTREIERIAVVCRQMSSWQAATDVFLQPPTSFLPSGILLLEDNLPEWAHSMFRDLPVLFSLDEPEQEGG